eukprot:COSAG05_NODE_1591_length_4465_cov_35.183830_4_plen_119_part_00
MAAIQKLCCKGGGSGQSDICFCAMAAVYANRTSVVVRILNPTGNTVNLSLEITRSAEAEVAATGKCLGGDGATTDTLAGGSLTADNSWAAPTAVSIVRTAVEVGDGGVLVRHTVPPYS